VQTDCLIIGAGLVGAAQAIACAQIGIKSVVVDKALSVNVLQSNFDGRVSAISHASVKVLSHLGLWEELLSTACPIEKIIITEGAKSAKVHFDADELSEPFGFMVRNIDLRKALLKAVLANENITLLEGAAINELQHQPTVNAKLSDSTEIEAELLIIADGRYSEFRTQVGIAHRKFEYGQDAVVFTIWHEKNHNNVATEWFFAQGPLALLPMQGGHHSCVVLTEKSAMAEHFMELSEKEFIQEIALKLQGLMGEIALENERFRYPLNLFQAEKYVAQNAVVIGDAAHAIHPIAGQGVNLGYRDVAALTEVLHEARLNGAALNDAHYLQQYQSWRSFDAASMIAVTDGLNRLFSNNSKLVRMARQVGMAAFQRTPAAKTLFIEAAMGISGDLPKMLQSA
jgi:2-octaprenyl-6-methoxyphenol hydroxylase